MIGVGTEPRIWRPQRFGSRGIRQIDSPVIEPVWSGTRLLAHVSDDAAELRDADGGEVARDRIAVALLRAIQADSVVLDGYLSPEAARSGVGVYSGPTPTLPTPSDMARQMIVGGRNRRVELVEALEARAEAAIAPDEEVAFVAVDLLQLDGEPLLDVPLLERKRLLDSVVAPSDLVRVGIHVRAPVDPWLGTWRNVGFRNVAYKDPNGRYLPGEPNDGWATAQIPKG
jgi:ATP-dependent DNA ligase